MTTHDVSLHVYDLRCARDGRDDATTRRRDAMKHLSRRRDGGGDGGDATAATTSDGGDGGD